ncbi:MAG: baseplate J/gp47 family protein, partial [Thermoanaerobaculia bacterium]
VTFGDGVRGSRLPSGVDNVIADYRHGAGAAKPPAGTIQQLARPVKGLRRVVHPVAASGGADADRPKDLRQNAPRASLTLGRAISLADFEALAHEFGGVVQAVATWAWDGARQRAVVKLWFISDGGDIAKALRAFLLGQAAPETPLVAAEAKPLRTRLIIDLVVDERYDSDQVELAVAEALTNADTGILALENIPIGCPLFRSRIFERVLAVEGAVSVRAMTVDGKPAGETIPAPEGHYRNFLPDLVVGNTAVGDVLFAQAVQIQISNQPAFVGIQAMVFQVVARQMAQFEVGG